MRRLSSGLSPGSAPAIDLWWRVVAGSIPSTVRPLPAESDLNTQTRPETFRLRAGNFNLLVLRLLDHRAEAVLPSLGDQFRKAPGFLRFAPIAIGLGDLDAQPDEVDFRALVEGLHALEIVPIGTTGGSARMRQAAQAAGLPPLRPAGGARRKPRTKRPVRRRPWRRAVRPRKRRPPPPRADRAAGRRQPPPPSARRCWSPSRCGRGSASTRRAPT